MPAVDTLFGREYVNGITGVVSRCCELPRDARQTQRKFELGILRKRSTCQFALSSLTWIARYYPIRNSKWFFRRVARSLVFRLDQCGLLSLYNGLWPRPGAIILMYHSVAAKEDAVWIDPSNHLPPEAFERQMQFLAKHRRVISLTTLIESLRQGESCPPGSVVITFDDGYRDNLTIAAPILSQYGLPATLFLPTGQIDRGEIQWIDEIYSCFRFRSCDHLSGLESLTQTCDLSDATQHEFAYRTLCDTLLISDHDTRRRLIDTAYKRLKPSKRPPQLTMTWGDVRDLQTKYPGFDIGGHTVNHTDMSKLTADQALQELAACRERIQQMTGVAPVHFSFPYGRTSPMLQKVVADALFESACGGGHDPMNGISADRFALRRVAAPSTEDHFGFLTNPLNSGLLHRMVR